MRHSRERGSSQRYHYIERRRRRSWRPSANLGYHCSVGGLVAWRPNHVRGDLRDWMSWTQRNKLQIALADLVWILYTDTGPTSPSTDPIKTGNGQCGQLNTNPDLFPDQSASISLYELTKQILTSPVPTNQATSTPLYQLTKQRLLPCTNWPSNVYFPVPTDQATSTSLYQLTKQRLLPCTN